eukprot:NODE_4408_length_1895_cov_5.788462.p1 GENE.NODE_4408_length_1895_cov_5.788462~~NODE_4408_length_1895_cov_5.788462.p1  ORF type:complete len:542 (-),score=138.48 NODE_4408_length_1895_cov_5.788462:228-1853(-)
MEHECEDQNPFQSRDESEPWVDTRVDTKDDDVYRGSDDTHWHMAPPMSGTIKFAPGRGLRYSWVRWDWKYEVAEELFIPGVRDMVFLGCASAATALIIAAGYWFARGDGNEPNRAALLWIGGLSTAFFWGIDAGLLSYFPDVAPLLGINTMMLGAIFAAGYFGPVLMNGVGPVLLPRLRRGGLMLLSAGCCVISSMGCGFVPRFLDAKQNALRIALFVWLRAVIGTACLTYQATLMTTLNTLYADSMDYASSIVFMFVSFSALWPTMCGSLYINYSYEAANWVPALMLLIFTVPIIALVARVRTPLSVDGGQNNEGGNKSAWSVIKSNGPLKRIFTVEFLPQLVWGFIVSTTEIEMQSLAGATDSSAHAVVQAGYLLAIYTGTLAVTSPIFGICCEKKIMCSRNRMVFIGQLAQGILVLGLIIPEVVPMSPGLQFGVIAILLIVQGTVSRFTVVPGPKILADMAEQAGASADVGFFLYQTAYTFGSGLGVLLGPLIVAPLGYRVAAITMSVISFLGLALAGTVNIPDPDAKAPNAFKAMCH